MAIVRAEKSWMDCERERKFQTYQKPISTQLDECSTTIQEYEKYSIYKQQAIS